MITQTPHQEKAIAFARNRICEGASVIAITGLAGTGKTSIIPLLRDALPKSTVVGTPTHRAAMVLRRKGVEDAETLHSLALAPSYSHAYTAALAWCQLVSIAAEDEVITEPPSLISSTLKSIEEIDNFSAVCHAHPGDKALGSIGLHGRDHIIGFGPRSPRPEILILDEASMVGQDLLVLARKVFRQIILIGDPGQLPPVRDVSVLETVEHAQLTEVHRQAADSAIIKLSYHARQGIPVWRRPMREYAPEVMAYQSLSVMKLIASPLIVWRNATRIQATKDIRAALQYPENGLAEGEPLVCRVNDKGLRFDGLYNNAMFTISKVLSHREVMLKDEMSGEEIDRPFLLHMEETDGQFIDPKAILFRWGYCLTAHTAQGGEWPEVYISVPDLNAYANMASRTGQHDELARWIYTSCTRAKAHLGFLLTHTFTK